MWENVEPILLTSVEKLIKAGGLFNWGNKKQSGCCSTSASNLEFLWY